MTASSNGATAVLDSADLMSDATNMASVLGAMQARLMVADTNLNLVYINDLALATMRELEHQLVASFGVTVDELLGGSIHRFHKDPAKVERTLADLSGFPRDVSFEFGETTISTKINLIRRDDEVVGYAVVWEDISERKRLEAETARVSSMMENSPTNMMYADRDLVVRYMNPASLETLRTLEEHLPIPADSIVGQSIDIFHKEPSHQRRMLGDPSAHLPSRSNIQVGPETLDLLVSPITDADGNYIGAMATWQVITETLRLAKESDEARERERQQAEAQ